MISVQRAACTAALIVFTVALPAAAQPTTTQSAATLRATGTFANNGTFAGTVTINRFEQRNGQIVAIGALQGTLSRANRVLGTALITEVAFPVKVSSGGVQLARREPFALPRLTLARATTDMAPMFRVLQVQATQGCTPVQVNVGATTVDVLGAQVALDPIGITVTGAAGTALGDLVCAAADLVGNVAGLVNLLNSVLGLVTGLLGGLAGVV
jgi:hypothetical protein